MLRLIQRIAGQHKLSAPWEGPFIVRKVLGNGSYYLIDAQKHRARKRDDSGKETERPWNANLLRRFYSRCSMYHAAFCIKYEDSGSPEKSSGATFFYLYDKYYAYECVISLLRLAPGSTSRPGGTPPSAICRLL